MTEATGHAHRAAITKCPQARQLKTAEIYSLSVVKAKNPKQGVCRAALSLEALLGGGDLFLAVSSPWLAVTAPAPHSLFTSPSPRGCISLLLSYKDTGE